MSVWGPAEVKHFLEAVESGPYYALFHTAITTGLRRSELLGLRWRDVDLDLLSLSVNRVLIKLAGGRTILQEPKTKRGRRSVALTPSPPRFSGSIGQPRRRGSTCSGSPSRTTPPVFTHEDSRPISPITVTRAFTRTVERLGLRRIRFHDLRHTHATLLLAQGTHPKVVQERLGHSTIAVTLDTYSHVLPGIQARAAQDFDGWLTRTGPLEEPTETPGQEEGGAGEVVAKWLQTEHNHGGEGGI